MTIFSKCCGQSAPINVRLAVSDGDWPVDAMVAVPIGAITALQALRDTGQLKAGQKVLINGASGGVGTFAVQIAKALGAEVTGVCSTRNLEMVRGLGADYVIDYTQEDYTKNEKQYDLIIDMVGNHSLGSNRKVMTPKGVFVIIGGGKGDWLGPFLQPLAGLAMAPFIDQTMSMMIATFNPADLASIADMMQAGKVTSVIDRRYSLNDLADAIRYSEKGHARGKIIITLDE